MYILMLTKGIERKLVRNCTRMLQAILNKSWKQHPMKQQLYGHLSPISKTIQIIKTRLLISLHFIIITKDSHL